MFTVSYHEDERVGRYAGPRGISDKERKVKVNGRTLLGALRVTSQEPFSKGARNERFVAFSYSRLIARKNGPFCERAQRFCLKATATPILPKAAKIENQVVMTSHSPAIKTDVRV